MFDKAKIAELEMQQDNWRTGCLQKTLDKIKMKAELPKEAWRYDSSRRTKRSSLRG